MQLWFWAAVAGMVFAGISNFGFKIAAKKGFDSETFTFYGGLVSVVFAGLGLLVFQPDRISTTVLIVISLLAGMAASQGNTLKVFALRYIDTTIFFPLFKLLSPFLAVMYGLIVFGERFTLIEWVGILLGHIVPLLLINNVEKKRQQNLVKGLIMVVLVSGTSSLAAALNKYAIDAGMSEWTTLWYTSWGIFIGSLLIVSKKIKTLPFSYIVSHTTNDLLRASVFRSILICLSMLCILFAYGNGGDLGIVQSIHALYIVIPIVLSVLIYQEHIDWKKVLAVLLCIVSLLLLG
jgi:drug/metabolite transporter (DMT)-like permease